MTVRVKIKEYIQQVTEVEAKKPPADRKPIPRQSDLADRGNLTRQTIYNFFAREDETRLINLDLLDTVIKTFRAFGHDTQLTDLIEFVEDS